MIYPNAALMVVIGCIVRSETVDAQLTVVVGDYPNQEMECFAGKDPWTEVPELACIFYSLEPERNNLSVILKT
jgi:hypothetical protein